MTGVLETDKKKNLETRRWILDKTGFLKVTKYKESKRGLLHLIMCNT